jgi:hypothetical protein
LRGCWCDRIGDISLQYVFIQMSFENIYGSCFKGGKGECYQLAAEVQAWLEGAWRVHGQLSRQWHRWRRIFGAHTQKPARKDFFEFAAKCNLNVAFKATQFRTGLCCSVDVDLGRGAQACLTFRSRVRGSLCLRGG